VCDACVNYLDSYKKTILLGRKAFESELAAIPQQVPEELVRAILAARKPR
jgi:hypothetical protein